ncbi:MAG: hypothetical protein ACI90V_000684, partial [Bacillariaceae sp.]
SKKTHQIPYNRNPVKINQRYQNDVKETQQ